jgi:hypothetical protein
MTLNNQKINAFVAVEQTVNNDLSKKMYLNNDAGKKYLCDMMNNEMSLFVFMCGVNTNNHTLKKSNKLNDCMIGKLNGLGKYGKKTINHIICNYLDVDIYY